MMAEDTARRDWGGRQWADYGAFYNDIYGQAIVEHHRVGRIGASLITADQSEGDWSDAPTPALVMTILDSAAVGATVDLGAGRICNPLQSGQFAVIAPDTAPDIIVHGRHLVRCIGVPYPSLLALAGEDASLPSDGDFGPLHARYSACSNIAGITTRLWGLGRNAGPHDDLAADGVLLELAAALLRLRDGVPARAVGGLAPLALRRCLDAIRDDAEGPSLSQLAEIAGLSGSHFSRAFKVSTGLSPAAWSMRHRVSEAEAALTGSNSTIAEIAVSCGFANQQHFTTAFKRHTGATPAAWRRERRG
jgi:AraC family transcriptional regulator